MSFFDKKEEVMDIQMTSYGKELLSKGKFKPVYYAFFDEGIIYDGARAGLTETQNNIQYRIKNETPFMKDTKDFLSPEEIVKRGELVPNELDAREIPLFDFDSTYENQLGASSNNITNVPAWKISALQSSFASSLPYLSGSSTSRRLQIPQINVDQDSIRYTSFVAKDGIDLTNMKKCEREGLLDIGSNIFEDGTELKVTDGAIFLKVREENSLSLMDNFEIELFEVNEISGSFPGSGKTKVLKPLKFFKFKPQIENGIMMNDGYSFENVQNLNKIDDTFASNYLEILIDDEIGQETLCRLDKDMKRTNLFIKNLVDCDVKTDDQPEDIYGPLGDGDIEGFLESIEEDCE